MVYMFFVWRSTRTSDLIEVELLLNYFGLFRLVENTRKGAILVHNSYSPDEKEKVALYFWLEIFENLMKHFILIVSATHGCHCVNATVTC